MGFFNNFHKAIEGAVHHVASGNLHRDIDNMVQGAVGHVASGNLQRDVNNVVQGAVSHIASGNLHRDVDNVVKGVVEHVASGNLQKDIDNSVKVVAKGADIAGAWINCGSAIPVVVASAVQDTDHAFNNAHHEVRGWFENAALPALTHLAEDTSKKTEILRDELLKFDWETVPHQVKKYVEEHQDIAIYIASGTLFIAPWILYGPVLGALGWTATGPAGGSLAAVIQSRSGRIAAGSTFALLQSAGMGGFGARVNGNLMRGGIIAAVAAKAVHDQQKMKALASRDECRDGGSKED